MQFRVAVVGGPQVQGYGRQFVYYRDCMAVFCEINSFDICAASVASFDADVRELPGGINREFVDVLFATGGADNSAVVPFGGAQGANQRALPAIAFRPQHAHEWLRGAQGTDLRRGVDWGMRGVVRKILGVGLKKHRGKQPLRSIGIRRRL